MSDAGAFYQGQDGPLVLGAGIVACRICGRTGGISGGWGYDGPWGWYCEDDLWVCTECIRGILRESLDALGGDGSRCSVCGREYKPGDRLRQSIHGPWTWYRMRRGPCMCVECVRQIVHGRLGGLGPTEVIVQRAEPEPEPEPEPEREDPLEPAPVQSSLDRWSRWSRTTSTCRWAWTRCSPSMCTASS